MQNTHLFKVLKTLDSNDISRFRKFLLSPYFNSNKKILDIFDYIRRFHPHYSSYMLNKENMFKTFFDSEDTSKSQIKRLTNLIYALNGLLEQYLIIKTLEDDKVLKQKLLVKAYDKTNNNLLEKQITKTQSLLQKRKIKDENYYLENKNLFELQYNHQLKYDKERHYLFEAMTNLDSYYLISKLKLSSEIIRQKTFFKEDYDIILFDEVLDLSKDLLIENPRVEIYKILIKIYSLGFSEENYYIFKRVFIRNKKELSLIEQKAIWTSLFNYLLTLVRKDESEMRREVWELQKIALNDGYLLENNQLSTATFHNIVIVGIFLKEFDWTKEFIENHSSFLPTDQRKNTLNFSWANYYFYRGDYQQVLSLLQEIEFTNLNYKYRTRLLLLQTYYELLEHDNKYYEVFFSLSHSFEKFIRRTNVLSKMIKIGNLNFITLIKLMTKYKFAYFSQKEELKKEIIEKINTMKYLVARPWFEEKIRNL